MDHVMDFIKKASMFCRLNLKKRGAILLEFAFAVPVLMVVVFFAYDVPTVYRLTNKLHKLTELFALNLDNATSGRSITLDDLKHISQSVGLSICGIDGNRGYPFNLSMYVTCIKGTGGGFTVLWTKCVTNSLQNGYYAISTDTNAADYSVMTSKSTTFPVKLKNMSIHNNEIVLLIESVIWFESSGKGRNGFNKLFYALSLKSLYRDRFAIIVPKNPLVAAQSFQ